MTHTFRAWVSERAGDRPRLADVSADGPGPGEVAIEVRAVGICHTDVSLMDGLLRDEFPLIAGHELSGIVVAVGPDVSRLQTGQRVVVGLSRHCGSCRHCESGHPMLCARRLHQFGRLRLANGTLVAQGFGIGGFAELIVVGERGVVPVPDGVDAATAAVIGCSVATGAGAVLRQGRLRPGEELAVIGFGGVGAGALLAGRVSGAGRIVVIEPDPARRALAKELGADLVLTPTDGHQDLPRDFDLVIECTGNLKAMNNAINMVGPGRRLVYTGLPPAGARLSLDAHALVRGQLTIHGSLTGDLHPLQDLGHYLELQRQGRLGADRLISTIAAFEELDSALAAGTAGIRTVVTTQKGGDW